QHAGMDGAWEAQELAARPVEASHMGDRDHRHIQLRIELDDAILVDRFGAGRTAGSFRVDDELATVLHTLTPDSNRLAEGLGARPAVDSNHLHLLDVPAEDGNPGEFALQDEHGVPDVREEGEGVPERLVLRRND